VSTIGRSGFKIGKKVDLTRTNSMEVAANIFNELNAAPPGVSTAVDPERVISGATR
jgi:hypothetical protein